MTTAQTIYFLVDNHTGRILYFSAFQHIVDTMRRDTMAWGEQFSLRIDAFPMHSTESREMCEKFYAQQETGR